jgi:hypothetical protein
MRNVGWTSGETIDWAEATKGPKPLDEGVYRARVTSAKPTKSSTDKPMIALELELYEDTEGETLKKRVQVRDYLVLTQAAAFRSANLCSALGIETFKSTHFDVIEEFCKDLVRAAADGVLARIKHEAYKGRDGNERTGMRVAKYLKESDLASSDEPRRSSNGAAYAEA